MYVRLCMFISVFLMNEFGSFSQLCLLVINMCLRIYRKAGLDDRGCTEKIHYAEMLIEHNTVIKNADGDIRKEKKKPVQISPTSSKPTVVPPQPPGSVEGTNANDVDID